MGSNTVAGKSSLFLITVQTGNTAHLASFTMNAVSLSGGEAAGAWHDHPPHLLSKLRTSGLIPLSQ